MFSYAKCPTATSESLVAAPFGSLCTDKVLFAIVVFFFCFAPKTLPYTYYGNEPCLDSFSLLLVSVIYRSYLSSDIEFSFFKLGSTRLVEIVSKVFRISFAGGKIPFIGTVIKAMSFPRFDSSEACDMLMLVLVGFCHG